MSRVDQLLEQITDDPLDPDDIEELDFDYDDLTPEEQAEYDRRLEQLENNHRDREADLESGMVIHGPGYHDDPYCGGY